MSLRDLVADTGPTKIDPDRLRLMGKQASVRFLKHGTSLTDGVVELVGEVDGIGPEHIKRVCEFANSETFQTKFAEKDGDDDRYVEFPYADPEAVLSALQIKDSPPQPPGLSDYHLPPPKRSAVHDLMGSKTASEQEKTAAPTIPQLLAMSAVASGTPEAALGIAAITARAKHDIERAQDKDQVDPVLEGLLNTLGTPAAEVSEKTAHARVFELLDRLRSWEEKMASEDSSLSAQEDGLAYDAIGHIKSAMLEHGPEEALAVMYHASGKDPHRANGIFSKVAGALSRYGVPMEADETKLASAMQRIPDPSTTLYQVTEGLAQIAEAREKIATMSERVAEGKKELEAHIINSGLLATR